MGNFIDWETFNILKWLLKYIILPIKKLTQLLFNNPQSRGIVFGSSETKIYVSPHLIGMASPGLQKGVQSKSDNDSALGCPQVLGNASVHDEQYQYSLL